LCVAVIGAGLLTAPTLSTVADAVSRLAPARARGAATGLQSSAQSAGFALGAPLAGAAIDLTTPAGGFATAGLAGLVAALAGHLLSRRSAHTRPERLDHAARPQGEWASDSRYERPPLTQPHGER
jgi:MFS family permease